MLKISKYNNPTCRGVQGGGAPPAEKFFRILMLPYTFLDYYFGKKMAIPTYQPIYFLITKLKTHYLEKILEFCCFYIIKKKQTIYYFIPI